MLRDDIHFEHALYGPLQCCFNCTVSFLAIHDLCQSCQHGHVARQSVLLKPLSHFVLFAIFRTTILFCNGQRYPQYTAIENRLIACTHTHTHAVFHVGLLGSYLDVKCSKYIKLAFEMIGMSV